ncbi:hypothetical protein AX17_006184 [Amanita inopinata Kibby_2008]|nr:hypothetical protein AX17_006184 [Amanita inopinata Kibby_2008]
MPLDGHSFLVAQGWAGKGSGLRDGSISRPLAIPQKRTLSGLGKDRDDAFPFWDHLFSSAAKSIQLKIQNSDSEDEASSPGEAASAPVLTRTSTGILSNRRPVTGASTATSDANPTYGPKYSLLVTAKREAAKKNLYSRFFRGPVLGPGLETEGSKIPATGYGSSKDARKKSKKCKQDMMDMDRHHKKRHKCVEKSEVSDDSRKRSKKRKKQRKEESEGDNALKDQSEHTGITKVDMSGGRGKKGEDETETSEGDDVELNAPCQLKPTPTDSISNRKKRRRRGK